MPSLRILPLGDPTVFGDLFASAYPGLGDFIFETLNGETSLDFTALARVGYVDLVLCGIDFSNSVERDLLKSFLVAQKKPLTLVLGKNYNPCLASEYLRCGAQDVVAIEGLTPIGLSERMAHVWDRHIAAATSLPQPDGDKTGSTDQTLDQLTQRMKEEAAERIRAEKALMETVGRYRFMLDSLPQIVWTADADGKIEFINRYWTRYSGRAVQETLNLGWGDSIHPDDVANSKDCQLWSIKNKKPFELQHRLRAADGSYRWHQLRALPRRDMFGNILEWIGTEVDIDDQKRVEERLTQAQDELGIHILERTSELANANEMLKAEVAERRRAEAEAQRAREIAETANRSKTEFLANISHEIRTPMNGIIGMTELALETNLDIQQREYLQLVANSADSLLVLINDMLDFAKIEAGRLELESESFMLRRTLDDALKVVKMRAIQKGLRLVLEIQPNVPAAIMGDQLRLRQVITNLLGNSLKFTEKGEIALRVSVISSRENRANLLFEVSDTGIGIPEDKQAVIFEAFAQVDGSMTRRFGGTGLGLAIVSSLVKKMGGDIRVRSKLGEGSTFSFNLPVTFDPKEQQTASGPTIIEATAPAKPGMRVLIVAEERSETAEALVQMLKAMNLNSTVVGLGEEAVGVIERARTVGEAYRLILVDATLGDMTGDKFVHLLSGNTKLKVPVVLMLAGTALPDEVKRAWAAGPDWILYKPIIPADLKETLQRSLLMVEPAGVERIQPEPALTMPQTKPPLRVLIAEDNIINQIVVERILLGLGCDIIKVNNGREAVEAVEKNPFDLILMDIQMPEMDGMEATRAIRSFPDARAHLPIVAMTAHAMKGDRERFLASGMDHYISKPFHKDELLLLVKSIESRIRATPILQAPPQPIPEHEGNVISLERFFKNMGGDETLFHAACALFLEMMPEHIREIDAALKEQRTNDAERIAHNLRSSLDSVGARDTSEMVTVMEAHLRSRDFPAATALFEKIQEHIREISGQIEAQRHPVTE